MFWTPPKSEFWIAQLKRELGYMIVTIWADKGYQTESARGVLAAKLLTNNISHDTAEVQKPMERFLAQWSRKQLENPGVDNKCLNLLREVFIYQQKLTKLMKPHSKEKQESYTQCFGKQMGWVSYELLLQYPFSLHQIIVLRMCISCMKPFHKIFILYESFSIKYFYCTKRFP